MSVGGTGKVLLLSEEGSWPLFVGESLTAGERGERGGQNDCVEDHSFLGGTGDIHLLRGCQLSIKSKAGKRGDRKGGRLEDAAFSGRFDLALTREVGDERAIPDERPNNMGCSQGDRGRGRSAESLRSRREILRRVRRPKHKKRRKQDC